MPLVGVDRFAHELQEQTLVKGAFAPELLDSLQPVYPVGLLPDCDDRMAWWYSNQVALVAVAAQYSTVWVNCASGRCIVDGIILINVSAAATYAVISRLGPQAAAAAAAVFQANPYSPRTAAGVASLAPVTTNSRNNAVGLNAGQGYTTEVAAGASAAPVILSWRNGGAPGWVIDANSSLVVESNAVNQPLNVSFWGRWLPEAIVNPS